MNKKHRKELLNELEIALYNANPTLMQYRKGKISYLAVRATYLISNSNRLSKR